MKTHIEVMYDPRYHGGRAVFEEMIYNIQNIHINWFAARKNPITGEYPDKIYNYYKYRYTENHKIALFIDEELPEEIRRKCYEAFDSVFKRGE